MKKLLVLLFATVLVLSACSSKSDNGGNKGGNAADTSKITVWAWDPNFNIKALNLAKEDYAAKDSKLTVDIIENAQNDIVQKLNTGMSSGTTKGLPNIVLIEDYRAQSFLQAYPDMFFDLSSYFKAEDFADYKLGPTSVDGKHYGLPFDSGAAGVFVRTDYLKEAGYTLADMQDITWEQYIEIGKKVKEKTGKNWISLDPTDLSLIRMMTQSTGAWYLKEDGKTANIAGNEAMKEAFEVYEKIMKANIVKPHADWSQLVANFNSGDVASYPTGNWFMPSIAAEASQSGKWGVAPLPKLSKTPNSVHAASIGGSSFYVLNVPGKEKAAEFLGATFGSDSDLYQKLITEVGAIGTYKPAAAGDAYKQPNEFFGGQKVVEDFAKWTAEVPKVNFGMHTYAIEDILVVEMQNFLNGKKLDQVLKDAQSQADAQIK
ncbi:ABC transporter substrate-binding protein [Paenibacillus radicis (ex Gao et al. 2016)]|uniref:ABC transporter substrate-binding protein n=1 Tax=Paenibacillus radicis (ex Gao et al. 2016) TaxID=1737354 RepID=A0A917GXZ4_9BACL|nr:ABC transporter substrate-binding protein [Paenibacillus radicis (ex Gao et al. 2016)]GGG61460.1 ABC transporter substrate-binding protein [Paenibacillus radicis (ex Gao et al. 2016)]